MTKETMAQARIDPVQKQDEEHAFEARIPNEETKAAIKEARSGETLNRYGSAAEIFEDLDS